MDSEWVRFFDLVERTEPSSPGLRDLAREYATTHNLALPGQPVLQVNGDMSPEHSNGSPPTFPGVPLRRCEDFLDYLGQRENSLRHPQAVAAHELDRIQAAQRDFWEAVRGALRAEQRSFAHLIPADFCSTEEEVLAGLRELQAEGGGQELHEFLPEIDQLIRDRERIQQ